MADKAKMKCNVVRASDRAGKKKMVKACANGKEKLIHFGAKGYGHNYSAAARKSFKARVAPQRLHQVQEEESIKLWQRKKRK